MRDLRRTLEREVAEFELKFGPAHLATGFALLKLAEAVHHGGDSAGAEPLYTRGADILRMHLGTDHPTLAPFWRVLCRVRRRLGNLEGARSAGENALAACLPEMPAAMHRMVELAGVLVALGDLKEVERLQRAALCIRRKQFPPDQDEARLSRWLDRAEEDEHGCGPRVRGRKKRRPGRGR